MMRMLIVMADTSVSAHRTSEGGTWDLEVVDGPTGKRVEANFTDVQFGLLLYLMTAGDGDDEVTFLAYEVVEPLIKDWGVCRPIP